MGAAADAVMLRWRSHNATAQSRRRAIETVRRRRKFAVFGRDAQGTVSTVSTEAVVLRKDFVQSVVSPTSGYVEAEVVFGSDGEISIWVPPGGGGGGGGTTYFPGGWT